MSSWIGRVKLGFPSICSIGSAYNSNASDVYRSVCVPQPPGTIFVSVQTPCVFSDLLHNLNWTRKHLSSVFLWTNLTRWFVFLIDITEKKILQPWIRNTFGWIGVSKWIRTNVRFFKKKKLSVDSHLTWKKCEPVRWEYQHGRTTRLGRCSETLSSVCRANNPRSPQTS
jgi:hypothetical protein